MFSHFLQFKASFFAISCWCSPCKVSCATLIRPKQLGMQIHPLLPPIHCCRHHHYVPPTTTTTTHVPLRAGTTVTASHWSSCCNPLLPIPLCVHAHWFLMLRSNSRTGRFHQQQQQHTRATFHLQQQQQQQDVTASEAAFSIQAEKGLLSPLGHVSS